ncbi:MAG: tetratricopeptide repeat protein [Chloroflexota bacterium]
MSRLAQRLGLTRYEADEHYKRALEAYNKNELEHARQEMTYAIELLPTNAEYYAARGLFHLEDSHFDEAQTDFEQALKLYPYEMLAHYGRGRIAYRNRNWEEALAHFADAYRADPERPETLYHLALTYHHLGRNALGLSYMQQAAARFDAQGNTKTRRNAERWIKEMSRLAQEEGKRLPGPS